MGETPFAAISPYNRELPREQRVVAAFVDLADGLVEGFDPDDLLVHLVDVCIDVLDIQAAGVLLEAESARLRAVAASSRDMNQLEIFEIAVQEGPSYKAIKSSEPVVVDRIETAREEWPAFTPAAIEMGFVACYSFPLRWRGDPIGALNLFLTGPQAPLEAPDLRAAQGFADVATMTLLQDRALQAQSERADQLQHALDSRVVIEQAKGILAERHDLDPEQAFDRLRRYCRAHNLRLRSAAEAVVRGESEEGGAQ